MARKIETQSEHFDLLPFINILMCTLGCLLLIALSVAGLSLSAAPEVWAPSGATSERSEPILMIWDGSTLTSQAGEETFCITNSTARVQERRHQASLPARGQGSQLRHYFQRL